MDGDAAGFATIDQRLVFFSGRGSSEKGIRAKSKMQVAEVVQTTSTAGTKGMWAIELQGRRGGGPGEGVGGGWVGMTDCCSTPLAAM